MVGNDTEYLCCVPEVVFLAAARSMPVHRDEEGENGGVLGRFELFFGAADAVVGRAGLVVSAGSS